jgi:hypothetical protein
MNEHGRSTGSAGEAVILWSNDMHLRQGFNPRSSRFLYVLASLRTGVPVF